MSTHSQLLKSSLFFGDSQPVLSAINTKKMYLNSADSQVSNNYRNLNTNSVHVSQDLSCGPVEDLHQLDSTNFCIEQHCQKAPKSCNSNIDCEEVTTVESLYVPIKSVSFRGEDSSTRNHNRYNNRAITCTLRFLVWLGILFSSIITSNAFPSCTGCSEYDITYNSGGFINIVFFSNVIACYDSATGLYTGVYNTADTSFTTNIIAPKSYYNGNNNAYPLDSNGFSYTLRSTDFNIYMSTTVVSGTLCIKYGSAITQGTISLYRAVNCPQINMVPSNSPTNSPTLSPTIKPSLRISSLPTITANTPSLRPNVPTIKPSLGISSLPTITANTPSLRPVPSIKPSLGISSQPTIATNTLLTVRPSIQTVKSSNITLRFNCVEKPQTFTVPEGVSIITVDIRGAEGGRSIGGGGNGGMGGRIIASIPVKEKQIIFVYVGCKGGDSFGTTPGLGGYNGGGMGDTFSNAGYLGSAGGGGASDIRTNSSDLTSRLLVAGGGGGGCYCSTQAVGGDGGGLIGQGISYVCAQWSGCTPFYMATGGTQDSGGVGGYSCNAGYSGSLGSGGCCGQGAGGGGGYYGGGSGRVSGGAGGSSYCTPTGTILVNNQGVNAGNGSVFINYSVDTQKPTSQPISLPQPSTPNPGIATFVSGYHYRSYYSSSCATAPFGPPDVVISTYYDGSCKSNDDDTYSRSLIDLSSCTIQTQSFKDPACAVLSGSTYSSDNAGQCYYSGLVKNPYIIIGCGKTRNLVKRTPSCEYLKFSDPNCYQIPYFVIMMSQYSCFDDSDGKSYSCNMNIGINVFDKNSSCLASSLIDIIFSSSTLCQETIYGESYQIIYKYMSDDYYYYDDNSNDAKTGEIIGIVIGIVSACSCLCGCLYYCFKKRKVTPEEEEALKRRVKEEEEEEERKTRERERERERERIRDKERQREREKREEEAKVKREIMEREEAERQKREKSRRIAEEENRNRTQLDFVYREKLSESQMFGITVEMRDKWDSLVSNLLTTRAKLIYELLNRNISSAVEDLDYRYIQSLIDQKNSFRSLFKSFAYSPAFENYKDTAKTFKDFEKKCRNQYLVLTKSNDFFKKIAMNCVFLIRLSKYIAKSFESNTNNTEQLIIDIERFLKKWKVKFRVFTKTSDIKPLTDINEIKEFFDDKEETPRSLGLSPPLASTFSKLMDDLEVLRDQKEMKTLDDKIKSAKSVKEKDFVLIKDLTIRRKNLKKSDKQINTETLLKDFSNFSQDLIQYFKILSNDDSKKFDLDKAQRCVRSIKSIQKVMKILKESSQAHTDKLTKDLISFLLNRKYLEDTSFAGFSIPDNIKKISWSHLKVNDEKGIIGSGTFADVVYAEWIQPSGEVFDVAVKVFKQSTIGDDIYNKICNDAIREASTCKQIAILIPNDYVIDILGITLGKISGQAATLLELNDTEKRPGILMRYEKGGSLKQLLYDKKTIMFDEKIRILKLTIKAIKSLHSIKGVHGDLKPENILLSDEGTTSHVRLADFGLSELRQDQRMDATKGSSITKTKSTTGTGHGFQGTRAYCAPEMLVDVNNPNNIIIRACETTDIYAFGVLCWEVLVRAKPFENMKDERTLIQEIIKGTRPDLKDLPDETPDNLKAMIKKCWGKSIKKRPTAAECYDTLKLCHKELNQNKNDIFICHADDKIKFLSSVVTILSDFGYKVHFEKSESNLDDPQLVANKISNSTVLLVCLSSEFKKNDTCMKVVKDIKSKHVVKDIKSKPVVVVLFIESMKIEDTDEINEILGLKENKYCEVKNIAADPIWEKDDEPLKVDKGNFRKKLTKSIEPLFKVLDEVDCRPSNSAAVNDVQTYEKNVSH